MRANADGSVSLVAITVVDEFGQRDVLPPPPSHANTQLPDAAALDQIRRKVADPDWDCASCLLRSHQIQQQSEVRTSGTQSVQRA
jgi:hypothetical protein